MKVCNKAEETAKISHKVELSFPILTHIQRLKLEAAEGETGKVDKKFKAAFMQVVTSSFGEELEQLRNETEMDTATVALLVDALHAGVDIFSNDTDHEAHCKWLSETK